MEKYYFVMAKYPGDKDMKRVSKDYKNELDALEEMYVRTLDFEMDRFEPNPKYKDPDILEAIVVEVVGQKAVRYNYEYKL